MNQRTLQYHRRKKGYTQEYMAKKLKVSASAYNLYENGGRKIPRDIAMKILQVLEIEEWEALFLPWSFTLRE